jgi:hypothetical protein
LGDKNSGSDEPEAKNVGRTRRGVGWLLASQFNHQAAGLKYKGAKEGVQKGIIIPENRAS